MLLLLLASRAPVIHTPLEFHSNPIHIDQVPSGFYYKAPLSRGDQACPSAPHQLRELLSSASKKCITRWQDYRQSSGPSKLVRSYTVRNFLSSLRRRFSLVVATQGNEWCSELRARQLQAKERAVLLAFASLGSKPSSVPLESDTSKTPEPSLVRKRKEGSLRTALVVFGSKESIWWGQLGWRI